MEARGQTFPADDHAAVLALEPGTRALGLDARDILFDRPAPERATFPDACGNLRADSPWAEATAEVLRSIALIRGQHLESCARSAPLTCADVQGLQPRDDWGALVPMGGRGACRQRHACGVREAVEKHALALAARRDALTAALARGNMGRPRRRTATE